MIVIEKITQGLLETAPDGIVIVNEDGRIVFVNVQGEALFGYAREELIGQPLETLVPVRIRDGNVPLHLAYRGAGKVLDFSEHR